MAEAATAGPAPAQILDLAVQKYQFHRSEISRIKKAADAEMQTHRTEMERLRIAMLRKLDSLGAKSLRTDHGIIVSVETSTPTCGDWKTFLEWVHENNRLDLLQKRIATQQMNDDIETWSEEARKGLKEGEELDVSDVLPPGITVITEREISIRKA